MRQKVVVVGLGYVGLPLAAALARAHPGAGIVGFDIDPTRIAELRQGRDRTGELSPDALAQISVQFTDRDEDCAGADIVIVAVPTPVDGQNRPDLGHLAAASRRLATWIDPGRRPTIVFESSVYPGATEEECGAIIAKAGLVRGRDFRLAYSPERINPGDPLHRVDKIVKVIAGEDDEVLDQLELLYGKMTEGGVFRARSIRTAEAAKAIENAQRDINIAFMNEVAQILAKEGDISVWDVLDAARTKWNFLPFEPGLVGGHCIGVDPYYLSDYAQRLGHDPRVILAGRGINDAMGGWIADRIHEFLGSPARKILLLGLAFKEDVPDVRNSRSVDIVRRLEWLGHRVSVADPRADAGEVWREIGLRLATEAGAPFDCVVAAVAHREYREWDAGRIAALLVPGATVADIKGIWRTIDLPAGFRRWSL
jgi:UDP-N-acetyl-D-galactosamine dehydrogenase